MNWGCSVLVEDDTSQGIVSEVNAKVEVMVRIHGGEFLSQADPRGGA